MFQMKLGCILNLVEFGCVGAEKKVGDGLVCGVVFLEKKGLPNFLLS